MSAPGRARRWVAGVAVVVAAAALPVLGGGCGRDATWPDDGKKKVVVSFAPIQCFAANVVGDDAHVRAVMSTTGPHDFSPTATDARLLRKADLFFVNGLGLDEKVADTLKTGSGNGDLKVIDLGSLLPKNALVAGEHHHDHAHGHDHGHAHTHPKDPHVWLSPDNAARMTEAIRDELKAADPAHAADYDRRAAEYVARLRQIKADGVALLKGKTDRRLVTFHESLAYFAHDFDLEIEGVVQKQPGVEPNSDELSALIKLCREEKVRLIAVEPQYSSNTSAKAIRDELRRKGVADAELVTLDPLETADPADLTRDWYERKMRANLAALAGAMK